MSVPGKLLDGFFRVWFFILELVAGKNQQFKTLVSKLPMHLNHPLIVGICQSSLGSNVNEKNCPLANHKSADFRNIIAFYVNHFDLSQRICQ